MGCRTSELQNKDWHALKSRRLNLKWTNERCMTEWTHNSTACNFDRFNFAQPHHGPRICCACSLPDMSTAPLAPAQWPLPWDLSTAPLAPAQWPLPWDLSTAPLAPAQWPLPWDLSTAPLAPAHVDSTLNSSHTAMSASTGNPALPVSSTSPSRQSSPSS